MSNEEMNRKIAVTEFQSLVVQTIKKHGLNGSISTTEIAWRLKTSRLAVWSAMRSLEKQGLAGYFRSGNGDRWSASMWFLRTLSPSEKQLTEGL